MYVALNTRPDISASAAILSQRICNPRKLDWTELKRVVRYLKGTMNLKLRLSENDLKNTIIDFSDADWAESRKDRKSNSGFVFKFNGGIVSWASRKQSCVSVSTTEVEFIALAEATRECIWLRRILADLDEIQTVTTIFEDNQS